MTDGPLRERLQAALGSAYTLDRELAGGGMSHVFVATETALRRRVVVKVLSPQLAEGISAERFAREIELAANLQDPHIVPVLNAGVAGNLPWFTMPYVEGESLRARLTDGTLPYAEAFGILRDVAMALEYAHAHGIVHRDIKPENVLLAGRTAVVADFGIAKALSAARTDLGGHNATLTSAGQSIGTPAYMAPEQAAGDPIDHRADLYAWGVMAWELLAGRHPFAGKASSQQLIAAHLAERPPELAEAKPGIAPALATFVMRCMEKNPGDRPASAGAIIAALDGMGTQAAPPTAAVRRARRVKAVLALLLIAAVGIGGLTLGWFGGAGTASATDAPRIAVLPFENLGDSADAYFVDGMTEAVRGKLTALAGMTVIARGSSNPYARTSKTPRQISGELGARYLLTGTVRFAKTPGAARVQVSPALVEVGADGAATNRWQQPFDADLADVFKVQGEIAAQVVNAMQVVLDRGSRSGLAQSLTAVPGAYDAFLRGQAAWDAGGRSDPTSLRRAIPHLEQAVALDAGFVSAWAMLGRSRLWLHNNSERTNADLRRQATDAVRRAFELDSAGSDGLVAMALLARLDRNYPRAIELLERARRVQPNDASLLTEIATVQSEMGRFEEALKGYDQAIKLDPRNVRPLSATVRIALRTGNIAAARSAGDRARTLDPTNLSVINFRAMTEIAAGNLAAAQAVVAGALRDVAAERVVAYVGMYYEMGWILTPEQDRLLLSLDEAAFDGSRATMAMVRAEQNSWRGNARAARAWGDSAARLFARDVARAPENAASRVFHGYSLALSGKREEAILEVRKGLALQDLVPGAEFSQSTAYFQYMAAQAAAIAGDREQSLTWLAEARRRRYYASPAWIRLDPTFKGLRGDPKFEQVLSAR